MAPNTGVQGLLGIMGVLAVPIVGYSLYTLYNTGAPCMAAAAGSCQTLIGSALSSFLGLRAALFVLSPPCFHRQPNHVHCKLA